MQHSRHVANRLACRRILVVFAVLFLACSSDQNEILSPLLGGSFATISTGPCAGLPYTRLVSVSTAAQLSSAVSNARAGDLIRLASGTYSGRWTMTQSGTAAAPIILCGPRTAVLNGGSISKGSGIFLNGTRYWTLSGFTITNALSGISGNNAINNKILSLDVHYVGQAGIHLRVFSKRNLIRDNVIHGTGKYVAQYGEGIYIGTAESQWCAKTNCQPDRSDSNQVIRNAISATTADGIQMMAGTTGGLIRRNTIDGGGMVRISAAPAQWVLVMGNKVLVDSNTAVDALMHGMKVHRSSTATAWGNNNVFRANKLDLGSSGYGIYLDTPPANGMIVKCNNWATHTGSGLSNVPCTP